MNTCEKFGTINEIVVVEGKTDTAFLKAYFEVETIETRGSALDQVTINLIRQAQAARGVILLLDNDYQGNWLRNKLNQLVPGLKNCYVSSTMQDTSKTKKGVAECKIEQLASQLQQLTNMAQKPHPATISWEQYLGLQLNCKQKRLRLCEILMIGYCNHKQLFKRLNYLGLSQRLISNLLT